MSFKDIHPQNPLILIVLGLLILQRFACCRSLGLSRYVMGQVTLFILWAAVVCTMEPCVFGVAGILSIGHMALFAVGGYATALMGLYFNGMSLWCHVTICCSGGSR